MNIEIVDASVTRRKKSAGPQFNKPFDKMNYNHGAGYGNGPPQYGHPHQYGPPPHPQQMYHEPQQQQQYDNYGNPINYENYQQSAPQYPPQQQQQQMYQEEQFVRRGDPSYDPNNSNMGPPQQNAQQYTRIRSESGGGGGDERILRNPHPHIPLGRETQETYDPSLPTYNATPIYHQPQQQSKQIVAPSISSIFELAAERVSKRIEQQQQQNAVSSSSRPLEPEPSHHQQVASDPRQQKQQQQQSAPFTMMSAPSASAITEVITGLVTQMQDMFGMVSAEVFFQTSTVVGNMPKVGDKVVVEAERVSGMPFKFNAKRVQMLSKDLISNGPPSSRDQTLGFERRSQHEDYGALPSMPNSLNLNKHQEITPPLKSILKRNPPPPPVLSERRQAPIQQQQTREKYRPESPADFNSASFSLDMRRDFPVIKQPSKNIQDLYPELLYVKTPSTRDEDWDKAESPSRSSKRKRSRSRSTKRRSSRSPRRRSRSRSPDEKRKSSPRRRSRSRERKSSRSPRSSRKISRSPRRIKRSRTRSIERIRRSKTPPRMRKDRRAAGSSSSRSKNDEDDIQILSPTEQREGISSNPFGDDSEIKAVIESSSLFPRMKKKYDDDFSAPTMKDFRNPVITSKPSRPIAPVKFSIQQPQPVPAPKMVPNPSFTARLPGYGAVTVNQNPNYRVLPQASINQGPSEIVAQVEKAIKKTKKKKLEAQEPAFMIMDKQAAAAAAKINQRLNKDAPPKRVDGLDGSQSKRLNDLKNSLQEQKMAQIEEQERLLRDQKLALAIKMREQGNFPKEKNVTQIVEEKLKGLRQNFEKHVGNGDGKIVAVEQMRQELAKRSAVEEERRLKAAGDMMALAKFHHEQDFRRRREEEERLERLRLEEMSLKKEKNWTALKNLRETFGGTAEREMELMRLREMRMKEEMADEERRHSMAEQEVHRRNTERSQRGSEGPVRRLVMETQIRQLAAAKIPVGQAPPRQERRSRSSTPPSRRRSPRSRSRERGRPVERRRTRSPERRVVRHPRTRSNSREKRSRRSRSREEEEHIRRREASRASPIELRRDVPEHIRRRDRDRDREAPVEQRREEELRQMQMREQLMVAQMEAMRRQEEELLMREREIHHRMQAMQEGRGQPHQEQYADEERYERERRSRY